MSLDRTGHAGSDGAGMRESDVVPPLTMFKAIRMQMDELGIEPDFRIKALADLPGLLQSSDLSARDGAPKRAGIDPVHTSRC